MTTMKERKEATSCALNIEQIKDRTKKKCPYYFSKNTLSFFGQMLRMFRVIQAPVSGRIFIYAPMTCDKKPAGYSFREFEDGSLRSVSGIDPRPQSEREIILFVNSL